MPRTSRAAGRAAFFGLFLLAAVMGGLVVRGRLPAGEASPANTMTVDAVAGGAIDAGRTLTDASPFDVDVRIQHGGDPSLNYSGYTVVLCFDSAVVDFLPTQDVDGDTTIESWSLHGLGGVLAHTAVTERTGLCPEAFPDTRLIGDGARTGTTDASGVAVTARFSCVGPGTTTLHLVQAAEHVSFSRTLAPAGDALPTGLQDATIACSLAPPTPCVPGPCAPTPTPTPTSTPAPTRTPDPAALPNRMLVDAVSGGDVDSARAVRTGAEFDVDIRVQHGGAGVFDYAGYDATLCFDSRVLAFVPTDDLNGDTVPESWSYTGLGGLYFHPAVNQWPASPACPPAFPETRIAGGAARLAGTTSASGVAATARFACVAPGTSTLHLITPDDWVSSTRTLGPGGVSLPTDLVDARITCLPDSDGDGCGDAQEMAFGFDPDYSYDVFDVPAPVRPDPAPNGTRDHMVDMVDVLAVLSYAYASDGGPPNANGLDYDADKDGDTVEDGVAYDRSASYGRNPPWDAGPPDGIIDMVDVLGALAQTFAVDCRG